MFRKFIIVLQLILFTTALYTRSWATSYTFYEQLEDTLDIGNSFYISIEGDSIIIADNPYYFRLFLPLTIYRDAISSSYIQSGASDRSDTLLRVDRTGFQQDLERYAAVNRALTEIYLKEPGMVQYNDWEVMQETVASRADKSENSGINFDGMVDGNGMRIDRNVDLVKAKPRYWKFFGYLAIKFSQNAYSDNWYKGGESNNQLATELRLEANYAKNNVTLDNKLEAKLGYYASESDGQAKFRSNSDLFRLTSKLGFKAAKSWYYSSQIQGYTQFLPVHNNDGRIKSRFFAPAYASATLGLDFKPTFKNKGISLSAQISPFAFNCRYVSIDKIAPNYGIEEGKNFLYDLGSRIETNLSWTLFKNFTWRNKVQFFTSYQNVEASCENTFNYAINRFFSLQLFVHWRFDDKVKKNEKLGYHQLNENFSFNFNYSW